MKISTPLESMKLEIKEIIDDLVKEEDIEIIGGILNKLITKSIKGLCLQACTMTAYAFTEIIQKERLGNIDINVI